MRKTIFVLFIISILILPAIAKIRSPEFPSAPQAPAPTLTPAVNISTPIQSGAININAVLDTPPYADVVVTKDGNAVGAGDKTKGKVFIGSVSPDELLSDKTDWAKVIFKSKKNVNYDPANQNYRLQARVLFNEGDYIKDSGVGAGQGYIAVEIHDPYGNPVDLIGPYDRPDAPMGPNDITMKRFETKIEGCSNPLIVNTRYKPALKGNYTAWAGFKAESGKNGYCVITTRVSAAPGQEFPDRAIIKEIYLGPNEAREEIELNL